MGPILFCGDPHGGVNGSFRYIVDAADQTQASAIVLLGDLEPVRPLHEELESIIDRTWWINGNHDSGDDFLWERVWGSKLADRCLDGKVTVLPDGTRVAGLGGVFREAVWYPKTDSARSNSPVFRSRAEHARSTPRQDRWRGGPHRKHSSTIYPDELDKLSNLRADVLVTHEAPGYHPNGFKILDTLAQSLGVIVTVHGHHHDRLNSSARWAAQGFASFGVGLRGITAIGLDGSSEVIRRGDLDDA